VGSTPGSKIALLARYSSLGAVDVVVEQKGLSVEAFAEDEAADRGSF
jgi:hypothetical protein